MLEREAHILKRKREHQKPNMDPIGNGSLHHGI